MFVAMTCACGAEFQVDLAHTDTLTVTWAQRFSDAHAVCGFMAPVVTDKPETMRRFLSKDREPQPKKEEM